MNDENQPDGSQLPPKRTPEREAREAAALRANLLKRKQQQSARKNSEKSDTEA